MHAVHIVKRFGPVGGMERYVWELVHALADLDTQITVVCEKAHQQPDSKIHVIELGQTRPKPRWVSMLRFSARVTRVVREQGWKDAPDTVIHSHERTGVHDVTTFHGAPMSPVKKQKLWWLSPRLIAWLWMEKRELLGPGRWVCPNSVLIKDMLQSDYPNIQLGPVAWPGVDAVDKPAFLAKPKRRVVFVGREFKRKGLPKLVQAMIEVRKQDAIELCIVGAEQTDALFELIEKHPWIQNVPWVENVQVSDYGSLLVHPAVAEPYGMVIAEAASAGLRCIVSDQCGAKDHVEGCEVIPASAPPGVWAQAILANIDLPLNRKHSFGWSDLAQQTLEFYGSIGR